MLGASEHSNTARPDPYDVPRLTHYELGVEAHGEGIPHDACPFSIQAFKSDWEQGWRDAEQHERFAFRSGHPATTLKDGDIVTLPAPPQTRWQSFKHWLFGTRAPERISYVVGERVSNDH